MEDLALVAASVIAAVNPHVITFIVAVAAIAWLFRAAAKFVEEVKDLF